MIIKIALCHCTQIDGFGESGHICDWASKNGPSGHIKFNYIFQTCCIVEPIDMRSLAVRNNLIRTILHITECKCCAQNPMYSKFCD